VIGWLDEHLMNIALLTRKIDISDGRLEGQERDDVTDKRATKMAAQIHHLVKALPASIR
jgi:hypothetical protein